MPHLPPWIFFQTRNMLRMLLLVPHIINSYVDRIATIQSTHPDWKKKIPRIPISTVFLTHRGCLLYRPVLLRRRGPFLSPHHSVSDAVSRDSMFFEKQAFFMYSVDWFKHFKISSEICTDRPSFHIRGQKFLRYLLSCAVGSQSVIGFEF